MRKAKVNPYAVDLGRNAANFAALTPLTFLEWSAYTYPERLAVVHGDRRFSWSDPYARARRMASALVRNGIGIGDTVAAMLTMAAAMTARSQPRWASQMALRPSPQATSSARPAGRSEVSATTKRFGSAKPVSSKSFSTQVRASTTRIRRGGHL